MYLVFETRFRYITLNYEFHYRFVISETGPRHSRLRERSCVPSEAVRVTLGRRGWHGRQPTLLTPFTATATATAAATAAAIAAPFGTTTSGRMRGGGLIN